MHRLSGRLQYGFRRAVRALALLLAVTPLALSAPLAATGQSVIAERTARVAIVSAVPLELDQLLAEADVESTRAIIGRTHHVGALRGVDVVLVLSGRGMINAAMLTQALVDHFSVRAIIFSGVAGGVNPTLSIGDVAVPALWGQYQEHLFARQTPDGWDVGGRPVEFGNYGMMFPRSQRVTRKDGEPEPEPEVEETRFWFPADPAMLELATRVASDVKLARCDRMGDCLEAVPRVVVGGNGVSGATFVENAAYRQWVWKTFQADALDMESTAVAHVAYVNRIPFLAFRSLSDLAGGNDVSNLSVFQSLAADNSAQTLMAFLEYWNDSS